MGKQLSLEKPEPFRKQKNGKRRHVLECEQALRGWEKERKQACSLCLYAALQQSASEEWRGTGGKSCRISNA